MIKLLTPTLLAPALLAACLAPTAAAQKGAAPAAPVETGRTRALNAAELALWNSEDFQRRIATSYLSETDIEPVVTAPERKQIEPILKLIAADDMQGAAEALEKVRTEASSAVFDFTLANIYFQGDDLERAIADYRRAVAKFPKFRRAWKNLALIHVRQGDFASAVPALTKVVELGGGDALTYGLLAFGLSGLDDHLAAESAYRMAILLDPATRDWKLGLARSFFKQERWADAVALVGKLIEETPEAAELWLLQANAFIGLGQTARAAENYEIVDRLGKSTADSLNMLADIYINSELYGLAVDCYARALDLDSKGGPERVIRAVKVLTARGASDESEALIAKVDEVFGDRVSESDKRDLLKLRARMAAAKGATDEEARILAEVVAVDPLDGEALILLGQYHAKAGDAEKAIFHYERAQQIEKFEADAKVRHAQLLVGQGKYPDAVKLLREAQQLKPRENIQQYLEQVERVAKSRA
jgi:tetratricopeptide (TPR) repeat protein